MAGGRRVSLIRSSSVFAAATATIFRSHMAYDDENLEMEDVIHPLPEDLAAANVVAASTEPVHFLKVQPFKSVQVHSH
jgi:hypothetical protein